METGKKSRSNKKNKKIKVHIIGKDDLDSLIEGSSSVGRASTISLGVGTATLGPDPSDLVVVPLVFLGAFLVDVIVTNIYVISGDDVDDRIKDQLDDLGLPGAKWDEIENILEGIKNTREGIEQGLGNIPPDQEPEDPEGIKEVLKRLGKWVRRIRREMKVREKNGSFKPRTESKPWKK